jgi:predicted transcriptional regulator
VNDPTTLTVDSSNAGDIIPFYNNGNYPFDGTGSAIESDVEVPQVTSGDGRVYAYFRSTNYETPVVPGKSRATFVSGVYALDENGSLLWNRTISGNAYSMNVVNNSTIFYRTYDDRFVVTGAGAAVGFALTTILYIFLRFFCIGAIARAHSRINKNENRNAVYDFIAKNPGLTMYEISRGLWMNIGTVRYHLFILGMNHRIVPYDGESKFVRYFTNSNSYSREDQAIVSLVRREAFGKVLGLMLTKPGASNVEIAMDLGIQESVVSRCVRELSEKGIVVKEQSGSRGAYAIDDSHKERVASAILRIYGE